MSWLAAPPLPYIMNAALHVPVSNLSFHFREQFRFKKTQLQTGCIYFPLLVTKRFKGRFDNFPPSSILKKLTNPAHSETQSPPFNWVSLAIQINKITIT